MQVRLLKHWNGYRPGTIFSDAGDGMANVLLDRGMAERTDGKKPADKPDDKKPADKKPADKKPADKKPADKK